MNEKTPFIVLTVVFVVGFVGLVMMMTEAKTGAYISGPGSSIYEKTRIASETSGGDPSQYWQIAAGGRAYYGGTVLNEQERNIRKDLGLPLTEEQEKDARLGIGGTVTDPHTKRLRFRQPTTNQRGCIVYNVKKRMGQTGWQYAAGTDTLKQSIRMLECYRSGEETAEGEIPMVRSSIATIPLTWGAEDTYCCFSSGLTSTY